MTFAYSNGTVHQAVVLSHEKDELRAVAPGGEDVLVFSRICGAWITDELDPVTITFAWERRVIALPPSEADCICHKESAADLIQSLLRGDEGNEDEANTLCACTSRGNRTTTNRIKRGNAHARLTVQERRFSSCQVPLRLRRQAIAQMGHVSPVTGAIPKAIVAGPAHIRASSCDLKIRIGALRPRNPSPRNILFERYPTNKPLRPRTITEIPTDAPVSFRRRSNSLMPCA